MSADNIPRIRLKAKEDRRLKGGHLWIFSNEVDIVATPLASLSPGAEVIVETSSGQPLGRGYANPHSLICCRLLSRDWRTAINQKLLEQRLQSALELRQTVYSQPYYRLVYGDADGLPGLVVDRFGDYLVAQLNTAGMERLKEPLLAALQTVLQPQAVLWRNDSPQREQEGLPLTVEVAAGTWPDQLALEENGVAFTVDGQQGQKTGWFYDHRENRRELQRWVKGQRVLDVFSYVGGWGLQCLAAGASELHAVDASETALDRLQANAEQQGVAEQLTCLEGNAFDVMKALLAEQQRFDVVIVDPPAFIKRRKDFSSGLSAYKKLNSLAIRLLAPNGLLLSASCSMHLPEAELEDLIRGTARHADRHAQLLFRGGQGPDHPVHPAIAETRYLKALLYRISPAL